MNGFVLVAWGLAAVGFAALAVGAVLRHAAAKRRLAQLETRA